MGSGGRGAPRGQLPAPRADLQTSPFLASRGGWQLLTLCCPTWFLGSFSATAGPLLPPPTAMFLLR